MRQLAEDDGARREAVRLRSPWFSGLFYLMVAVVIVSLLLVFGRLAPWWAFPLVVLGAILLVSVVGALQMRQDDRLSELGFPKTHASCAKVAPPYDLSGSQHRVLTPMPLRMAPKMRRPAKTRSHPIRARHALDCGQ
jgi:hypothetical protein